MYTQHVQVLLTSPVCDCLQDNNYWHMETLSQKKRKVLYVHKHAQIHTHTHTHTCACRANRYQCIYENTKRFFTLLIYLHFLHAKYAVSNTHKHRRISPACLLFFLASWFGLVSLVWFGWVLCLQTTSTCIPQRIFSFLFSSPWPFE